MRYSLSFSSGQAHERRQLPLPASMRVFHPSDSRAVEALRWRASPLAILVDETGLVLDRIVPNALGQLQVLARRYGRSPSKAAAVHTHAGV